MQKILPGVFHWTEFHPDIEEDVHSYSVASVEPAVLIDPMFPDEGVDRFSQHAQPEHIYLSGDRTQKVWVKSQGCCQMESATAPRAVQAAQVSMRLCG